MQLAHHESRRDLEDAVLRANEAKRIFENPEFVEVFAAIEAELHKRWKATSADDTQAREMLWYQQNGLDMLRKQLTKPIDEGKIAHKRLETIHYQANLD